LLFWRLSLSHGETAAAAKLTAPVLFAALGFVWLGDLGALCSLGGGHVCDAIMQEVRVAVAHKPTPEEILHAFPVPSPPWVKTFDVQTNRVV
jgi:hypothetical protein